MSIQNDKRNADWVEDTKSLKTYMEESGLEDDLSVPDEVGICVGVYELEDETYLFEYGETTRAIRCATKGEIKEVIESLESRGDMIEDSSEHIDVEETALEPKRGRYDGTETVDGSFVLYDRENHQAWIQSDTMVQVED